MDYKFMVGKRHSAIGNLLSASSVYLTGSIITSAIAFFLMPVFTRYLTPEDYGVLATYSIISQILIVFIGLNAYGLIVREFYDKNADLKGLISSNFWLGAVICLAIALFAFLGRDFLSDLFVFPKNWLVPVVLLSFAVFFQSTLSSILQAQQKPRSYITLQIVYTLMTISLSLLFIIPFGMDWRGRFYAAAIASIPILIFGLRYLLRQGLFECTLKKERITEITHFGIPLIPHSIGGWVMTTVDRLYLNHLCGIATTGLYSVAFAITSVLSMVIEAVNKAMLPLVFDKLNTAGDKLKKKLVLLTYAADISLILAAVALGYVAEFFLGFFVGEKFQGASVYVFWLALAVAFMGCYRMRSVYIIYTKKTYLMAFTTDFLGAIVNLILCPILIILNGPIGAAQSTAVAYFTSFIGCWIMSQKAYPMPWFKALYRRQGDKFEK